MGLLSRAPDRKLKNEITLPSTSGPSFGQMVTRLINGKPISYVSANTAMLNSDVYAVSNRISSDMASAQFKTASSYALDILNNPSNTLNRFAFWQGIDNSLLWNGNAYAVRYGMKLQQRRSADVSIEVVGSHADHLRYTFQPYNGGPKEVLDESQVLHFKIMPNPQYDYLIGTSPLESLKYEMEIAETSKEATLNSVKKQISPIGILTLDASVINPEDTQVARDSFERLNSGENRGRLMVLHDGEKFSQLDVKADVFKALTENADYSASQISKAFGIPVDMLGGGKSTESQHSNIDSIKAEYVSSLNSYINPILDELRLKLGAPDLKLDVKEALDVDDSLVVGQINSMAQAGVLSPNQAQFLLKQQGILPNNIPDFEGGDSSANN